MTWTGIIDGVTDPLAIKGISVAFIEKIMGVGGIDMGASVVSVQSGLFTVSNGNLTGSAEINAVDLDQSICLHLGQSSGADYPDDGFCTVKLLDSTHVEAQRMGSVNDISVSFIVVEFSGLSSVQQGTVTMAAGTALGVENINEVNLAKAVLFFGGFRTSETVTSTATLFKWMGKVRLNTSTQVGASRWNASTTKAYYINYTVVEFE